MRQIILSYEFVLVFFACFMFFLLVAMFIKRKIVKNISLLFFSIFFVLFFFELILSFFMPLSKTGFNKLFLDLKDTTEQSKMNHIKLFINNKSYEFNNKEEIDIPYSKDSIVFEQTYTIFPNKFRVTKCNENSDSVYVFIGCSYTFGLGVADNETLPYYFSKLFDFNKNIINCGLSARGSNAALNVLNNDVFLPLIKNKSSKIECFVYTLIFDHVIRNFNYEDKYYRIDGFLYKNNKRYIPTTIGKIKYIFARSYIFRKVFVPIIDEYFEQYYEDYLINTLKEINKIVEEKYNSKLVIMWNDHQEKYKRLCKKLKETNLDLIFLPEYFNEKRTYKLEHDGHPTAKANEEIAQILYNHINNK